VNEYLRRHGATLFLVVSALLAITVVSGLEGVATALALAPLLGFWASWKLYRWHRFYGTRFLWGLFLASVAANLAALPVAFLSARRVFLGPDAPGILWAGPVLGVALIVLEGVFVYLVLRWSDLDLDMKRVRIGLEDEVNSTNVAPEESI
jgi:hypothetical protein